MFITVTDYWLKYLYESAQNCFFQTQATSNRKTIYSYLKDY